jgi:ubiquinone biosynthesis protein UbiJ
MPLTNLLCGLLETGVNQLHQLDSSAVIKRKHLNGTIVCVSLKELNIPLFFVISEQKIDILNKYEGQPDCTIRVSVSALNQLQDSHQLTRLIKSDQLEVEGDIQLVQQFAKLLTEMDIDWEEHLSHKVGDVIAHKLCYHSKHFFEGVLKSAKKMERQTALYVTEEAKLAPSKLEVAYFCEQVESLEAQLKTLQLKIDNILNHHLNAKE